MNTSLEPTELLSQMDLKNGKWRIAPYYYCYIDSSGQKYRVEHPKSASKGAAEKLASKYQCHVLQGHSHLWRNDYDISGKFHACHIGHTVDEERLAYAAQRSTIRDTHKLGAAIVRDGHLWMLGEDVDWKRLEKCK